MVGDRPEQPAYERT